VGQTDARDAQNSSRYVAPAPAVYQGCVIDWLYDLDVVWIALIVFAAVAVVIAVIWFVTLRLATGARGAAMQSVSPGLLPPLGIVFALIVGFLAVGVWGDSDKAKDSVSSEASALRAVSLLSNELPADTGTQIRALVARQIDDAVHKEWPAMAKQHASLEAIPAALAQALDVAITFKPAGSGQADAQRELVSSLEKAFDARRARIIVSSSRVNAVKWIGLLALAALMLIGVACVHSANRRTSALALALFGAAVAVVVVMLVAQDRPFTGQLGQKPDLLEQVAPTT
jgi:hypothetical protein